MKIIGALWLSLILIGSSQLIPYIDQSVNGTPFPNDSPYAPHSPIVINSNADFNEAHCVVNWATGNGSQGNPWIIENWEINGLGFTYCFSISDTTEYFIVRNCYFHNASVGDSAGLNLYNVTYGLVENNTLCNNNWASLYIRYSDFNVIRNNTFFDDNWGIYSKASSNNTYLDNHISVCNKGLWLGKDASLVGSHYNKVINNNATECLSGIIVARSHHNLIENNNASWNVFRGIRLDTADYNIVRGNNASNNGKVWDDAGISLYWCSNNTVTDNILLNNYMGITNRYSSNNTFINNTMIGGGIYIFSSSFIGKSIHDYNTHTIDLSNTINNKPVYYWKNRTSGVVPSEAGQTILANCSNVTIENFNFQNVYCGIIVGFSQNVIIANNTATRTGDGIQLTSSTYCTVKNNTISETERFGLHLFRSNRNQISNNSFLENQWRGMYSAGTYNNSIHDNNVVDNIDYGFYFTSSGLVKTNNFIFHNNFINTDNYDRSGNFWNLSYPGGGNYWNGNDGLDVMNGPGQDIPGSDGFSDSNYSIDGEGGCFDEYPLMRPIEFEFMKYNISLNEDWNLISLPFEQFDESIEQVLSSISGKWDCIQTYDSILSEWNSNNIYTPDSLNDFSTLNHKQGFWINITELNVNLTVSGYISTSTNINLYAGWNLVGYPTLTEKTVADALWGTGADKVEAFDSAEPYRIKEVGPTYLMKPGEGYWVHVPMDTTWIIDW